MSFDGVDKREKILNSKLIAEHGEYASLRSSHRMTLPDCSPSRISDGPDRLDAPQIMNHVLETEGKFCKRRGRHSKREGTSSSTRGLARPSSSGPDSRPVKSDLAVSTSCETHNRSSQRLREKCELQTSSSAMSHAREPLSKTTAAGHKRTNGERRAGDSNQVESEDSLSVDISKSSEKANEARARKRLRTSQRRAAFHKHVGEKSVLKFRSLQEICLDDDEKHPTKRTTKPEVVLLTNKTYKSVKREPSPVVRGESQRSPRCLGPGVQVKSEPFFAHTPKPRLLTTPHAIANSGRNSLAETETPTSLAKDVRLESTANNQMNAEPKEAVLQQIKEHGVGRSAETENTGRTLEQPNVEKETIKNKVGEDVQCTKRGSDGDPDGEGDSDEDETVSEQGKEREGTAEGRSFRWWFSQAAGKLQAAFSPSSRKGSDVEYMEELDRKTRRASLTADPPEIISRSARELMSKMPAVDEDGKAPSEFAGSQSTWGTPPCRSLMQTTPSPKGARATGFIDPTGCLRRRKQVESSEPGCDPEIPKVTRPERGTSGLWTNESFTGGFSFKKSSSGGSEGSSMCFDGECFVCENKNPTVRCQSCPRVVHHECLSPSLFCPPTSYVCPKCAHHEFEGKIEEILCCAPAEEDANASEDMFHVKLYGRSYLATEWVTESDLMKSCARKLQNFRQRESKRVGLREGIDGWHDGVFHEWLTVDRVVARSGDDALVRWKSLPYTSSTWEPVAFVAERFPQKLEAYKRSLQALKKENSNGFLRLNPFERPVTCPQLRKDELVAAVGGEHLYEYQVEGVQWLLKSWFARQNVVLADEMGLGKTIQVIGYILKLHQAGWTGPSLIVCPLSTVKNWAREFEKWAPQINAVTYVGDVFSRRLIRKYELGMNSSLADGKRCLRAHVIITSYEMLLVDKKDRYVLRRLQPFHSLIVDEGHRLKGGYSARLFEVASSYRVSHKVLLTGTPLQNKLVELFNLLEFLDPGRIDPSLFLDSPEDDAHIEQLRSILQPRLMMRTKSDVCLELPPKKEITLPVPLTKLQRDCYMAILTKKFGVLRDASASTELKNVLMELRKCCNHPYLVSDTEPADLGPEQRLRMLTNSSGKLQLLDRMLPRLKEQGRRVLLFSQMTMLLDIVDDYLHLKQFKYERLDGKVKVEERQRAIDRFSKDGTESFIFLLSTRAGGLGINLTAADTVIIFDSDWNPHMDTQAQARAHRIGQSSPVLVYRFVSENTVEEQILSTARRKLALNERVVRRKKKGQSCEELSEAISHGVKVLARQDLNGGGVPNLFNEAVLDLILDRHVAFSDDALKEDKLKFLVGHQLIDARRGRGGQGEDAASPATPDEQFWDSLLKGRVQEQERGKIQQELGRGRRSKREVDYTDTLVGGNGDREQRSSKFELRSNGSNPNKDGQRRQLSKEPERTSDRARHSGGTSNASVGDTKNKSLPRKEPQASPKERREQLRHHLMKHGLPVLGIDQLTEDIAASNDKIPTTQGALTTDGVTSSLAELLDVEDGEEDHSILERVNDMALIRLKLAETFSTRKFQIRMTEPDCEEGEQAPGFVDSREPMAEMCGDIELLLGIHIHGWGSWTLIVQDDGLNMARLSLGQDQVAACLQKRAKVLVDSLRREFHKHRSSL
ncbi:hypothetical protein NDN08_001953 [Rhodosorus marinus]|uniref:Uncharacterized protein n=1 Tax=Rhodosorus marinus TaxID=101924 RepID=A0AAV8UV98_9RHOD|nr:hypothetical protein NDN08_001953 [Rhodosorus marinus]